jgi:hypothetical protein
LVQRQEIGSDGQSRVKAPDTLSGGANLNENDGSTGAPDFVARLRKVQPTIWELASNLAICIAGLGFVLVVAGFSHHWRDIPGFMILPFGIGFGSLVRFAEHLRYRAEIGRILRDCGANMSRQ